MSIIDDALKKTQETLDKKDNNDMSRVYEKLGSKPPSSNKEPPPSKKAEGISDEGKKQKGKKIAILGIILLIAFGFVLKQFVLGDKNYSKIKTKYKRMFSSKKKPTKPKIYKKGELVVNGIMKSGDKNVALINGKIFEEGETIQGMEIVAISMNQVEIYNNGQRLILPVR